MYFPNILCLDRVSHLGCTGAGGILMVMRLAKPLNSSPISKNLRSIPFSKNWKPVAFSPPTLESFEGVCANTTP